MEDFNPEDMPIIEGLDLSKCKEFHIEEYFLSSHVIFNPNDYTSSEDLCKLLDKKNSWEQWMLSQIEEDSAESYKEWHDRMSIRCDLPSELIEAYDKMFGEKNGD